MLQVIVVLLIALPLYAIVKLIAQYILDPHKLQQYPPINPLAAFTHLGYTLHLLLTNDNFRTRRLYRLHQKHPIIRLGPNHVSYRSVEAIHDIYGHSSACIKGDMYSTPSGGEGHTSVLSVRDKDEHSVKRRRLAAAFAIKNLVGWEDKVWDKCKRLIAQMDERMPDSKGVLDMRLWTNLFTIEAIADIALSQRLGVVESGNDFVPAQDGKGSVRMVRFRDCLHANGRANSPVIWSTEGYWLMKVLTKCVPSWQRQWRDFSAWSDISRYLVTQRMQRYEKGEELDDFTGRLLEYKDGSKLELDREEIEAEVGTFMDAGSDTTAIALTHLLYQLCKNLDKLELLRRTLKGTFEGEIPSFDAVRNNNYLRACIDESLRLLPPVSFGLQRKTPPEGAMILGDWVPGNTLVGVPAYVAHRDPEVFLKPESFCPERWLGEAAKKFQKYYIAFSAGARGCIGRNISYLEQHVLVAALVMRYDMELADPRFEMVWEERFNLWAETLPIRFTRRKSGLNAA